MPKMKTHSGATKRFRRTGAGKITRGRTHLRHNLEGKSSTRKRALGRGAVTAKADVKRVNKLLGG
jgi:large subunit ribosomal protein L35